MAFKDNIGAFLVSKASRDSDMVSLTKAAEILRKYMLGKKYNFKENFDQHCQKDSVPVPMIQIKKNKKREKKKTER